MVSCSFRRAWALGALGALAWGAPALAGDGEETEPPPLVDVAAAYYVPTDENRAVNSVFVNAAIGVDLLPSIGFSAFGGVTLTYATGHIVQWNDYFEDVRYETEAAGVGPIFLLRWAPLRIAGVALAAEMVGGVVLYSNDFPAGGDIYNFTWRFGGSLSYQVDDELMISAGVRWMHVSNGQGLGPQNPSYEGVGFPISVTLAL